MSQLEKVKAGVEDFLTKYPFVDNALTPVSEKTKVSKINLVLGVGAFTAVWLAIGYGSPFLCDFIGFIFPAYLSFKAVETPDTRDDTQWLTYWIVYSYFGIVEFFSDYLLFWIPFYSLIKCCFLVWMVHYQGASTLYNSFIRPWLVQNESRIDAVVDKIDDAADKLDDFVERSKDD